MNISYQTYERVKLNFTEEDSMYYMDGGNSSLDNEDPNIPQQITIFIGMCCLESVDESGGIIVV